MKIGAANLVLAWGRPMQFWRAGAKLFDFKGRRAEYRPDRDELEYSLEQHNYVIIGVTEQFGGVIPVKFDWVIDDRGERFTVLRGRVAGADEDELVKMLVRGGQV